MKIDSPISVIVDGSAISVNELQCENVNGSILVTAVEMVASLRALQFENKWFPIVVTEFGISIFSNEKQSAKHESPIAVVDGDMVTSFNASHS